MSKELPGLDIFPIPGQSPSIDEWRPRLSGPDLIRPITKMGIAVVFDQNNFYPLEIDLDKKGPKTIFIVGDPDSEKEKIMKGIANRACRTIAYGHLGLKVITKDRDPNKLINNYLLSHIRRADYTTSPGKDNLDHIISPVHVKTLPKKYLRIKSDPHLFLIEDLGSVLGSVDKNQERLAKLRSILDYKDDEPILNIASIDPKDLEFLKTQGIDKDIGSAIWLFGKFSSNKKLSFLAPGVFHLWNRKKNDYSPHAILPFEF